VRRLTTRTQIVALLYGQFSGAASLREIEAGLTSHAAQLYHLGAREVSRAQAAAPALQSPLAFARLGRCNLLHRRPLDRLLKPPPQAPSNPRQLCLVLQPI
jgi:hypothetical protein